MLFPSLYEELNIERYAAMAQDMLQNNRLLIALCDDSGQVVWVNSDDRSLIDNLDGYRERGATKLAAENCEYLQCQSDGNGIIYCSLGELQGLSAGDLVFCETAYDDEEVAHSGRIPQVLSNIASLVKTELQYLYELNAMAKELG